MINDNKHYTEEFARDLFTRQMKQDVIDDCAAFGYKPDFSDLNRVLLADFVLDGIRYVIAMDAINAIVTAEADGKTVFTENFAGQTDHSLFLIGDEGIMSENDYAYVFLNIYSHMFGIAEWTAIAVREATGASETDWRVIERVTEKTNALDALEAQASEY